MNTKTDIELIFSDPEYVSEAKRISEMLIRMYYYNRYEYLPFDNMKKEDGDGLYRYPARYVRFEYIRSFEILWKDYKKKYIIDLKSGRSDYLLREKAEEIISHIEDDGSRFIFHDCGVIQDKYDIENYYFEDFFSLLCFFLAVLYPEVSFEGMRRRSVPGEPKERLLTHVTHDHKALTFEHMRGDPSFSGKIVSWIISGEKLIKISRLFPFIRVDLITDDCDAVKQDEELNRWIQRVNDVRMELVSAELCFLRDSYPHVMISASSRELCVRLRDELCTLLNTKGYQTRTFSILYPNECSGPDIVVPDSVTMIGRDAFRDNTILKNIVIPRSVTKIDEGAFRSCESLENIILPDSVVEIGSFAFMLCTGLKTVTLPQNLKLLDTGVFSYCSNLEGVIIPESVVEIERYVFSSCENLKSIVIPSNVKKIGKEAFQGCKNLATVILPKGTVEIADDAFKDCSPDISITEI